MSTSAENEAGAGTRRQGRLAETAARWLVFGLLGLFALLSSHAHPAWDDFHMSVACRHLGLAAFCTHMYEGWSGDYAENVVLCLVYGRMDIITQYWIVGLAGLSLLLASTYVLFVLAVPHMHPSLRWQSTALLVAIEILCCPAPNSNLYWLITVIAYTLSIGLLQVFVGLLVRFGATESVSQRRWCGVGMAILVVCLSGYNPVTIALVDYIVGLCALISVARRRRSAGFWIPVLILCAACSAAAVLAPGVKCRMYGIPEHGHLVHSLVHTSVQFLTQTLAWTFNPILLAGSVLLWPLVRGLRETCGQIGRDDTARRLMAWFPAAWVLSIWVALFPAYWALGTSPPARTLNLIYAVYLLGWLGSLAVVAFLMPSDACSLSSRTREMARIAATCLLVIGVLASPVLHGAVKDVVRRGYRYDREAFSRYEMIRQAKLQGAMDLTVPALDVFPITYVCDIGVDPTTKQNKFWAGYFGLRSIRADRAAYSVPD